MCGRERLYHGGLIMDNLIEEKLDSQPIFSGRVLKLRLDRVKLPNGQEATREVVEHPGAVGVIPLTEDGKLVLVRQYRYPLDKITVEIPAGKLGKGENPDDCALRELEEETGYVAGKLEKIGAFYTTVGFSDELMHLYIAKDLTATAQNLDGDEFINVEICGRPEVDAMIRDGSICDLKTVLGLKIAGF